VHTKRCDLSGAVVLLGMSKYTHSFEAGATMQRSVRKYFLALLLLALWPVHSFGHSGNTDRYGCHNDRQSGGYHCHRGPCARQKFNSQREMLAAECAAPKPPPPAVECTTCDRRLVECRKPLQEIFVACMNTQKSDCGSKCGNDCREQKNAQKCTVNCVKSCQGENSCQMANVSQTKVCTDDFQACKRNCTVSR